MFNFDDTTNNCLQAVSKTHWIATVHCPTVIRRCAILDRCWSIFEHCWKFLRLSFDVSAFFGAISGYFKWSFQTLRASHPKNSRKYGFCPFQKPCHRLSFLCDAWQPPAINSHFDEFRFRYWNLIKKRFCRFFPFRCLCRLPSLFPIKFMIACKMVL